MPKLNVLMKEKVAKLPLLVIYKTNRLQFDCNLFVYESEINYLLKRSRRVFIMSCVIESRS